MKPPLLGSGYFPARWLERGIDWPAILVVFSTLLALIVVGTILTKLTLFRERKGVNYEHEANRRRRDRGRRDRIAGARSPVGR